MILALETASAACSVAVGDPDGRLLAEITAPRGPAHTQRLLPDVHHALTIAGVDVAEVHTVVVGIGPGTFTGLRIGVATARALAQALGARLGGVPTIAALALALADGDAVARAAWLVPLIDGKRGEVFAACYSRTVDSGVCESAASGIASCLEVVRDVAAIPAAQLQEFLSAWPAAIVGGDGAYLYAHALPTSAHFARGVEHATAAMLLRAWSRGVPGTIEDADAVLPIYGRAPDAARWLGKTVAAREAGA